MVTTMKQVSEELPLSKYGVFDGVHILCGDPVYPVAGGVCGAHLDTLQHTHIYNIVLALKA